MSWDAEKIERAIAADLERVSVHEGNAGDIQQQIGR